MNNQNEIINKYFKYCFKIEKTIWKQILNVFWLRLQTFELLTASASVNEPGIGRLRLRNTVSYKDVPTEHGEEHAAWPEDVGEPVHHVGEELVRQALYRLVRVVEVDQQDLRMVLQLRLTLKGEEQKT